MAGSGRRRLQDGGRHVVVVESPAKARTIGAWLGPSYRVMATRGHVRDLPARAGSVDPGDGFSMVYETGKRAARTLGAIAKALARADILVLATDPDREGEAIAWQVLSWLAERDAVGDRPVLRVVFHEVTPTAVRRALIRPRAIDMDLVRAWQARRALDYLVGYGLSPVLWRKLPGCRSAGRVQSVALRLVCEREAEIEAFAPQVYWTVEAELAAQDGAPFPATLCRLDGEGIDDAGLASERMAKDAVERIRAGTFAVSSVERDTLRRQPLPPFTTATLQQEAARRLGFGIGETMAVAQRLYEGVDLGGETAGLVTYMRTDSTAMATTAAAQARAIVRRSFGDGYVPAKPNVHRSRARHAQEAHEAIRPTDFERTPENLGGRLDRAAVQLYGLIRDRALASQMPEARFDRVRLEIASEAGDIVLEASGLSPAFDGHLRVWDGDGNGGAGGGDPALAALETGTRVSAAPAPPRGRATQPPPRYTEAGLVRRLDELGIGRPSTWAATHDGATAFTFRLSLSADIANGDADMRDSAFEVTGGSVTGVGRVDGRSDLWEITVTPDGTGNIGIVLAANRECGTAGALCTADGRMLTTALLGSVTAQPGTGTGTTATDDEGPAPLTAQFVDVPAEHDGESKFRFRLVFSDEIFDGTEPLNKNKAVRDALAVTGGVAKGSSRVDKTEFDAYWIDVRPSGNGPVTISLSPAASCGPSSVTCTPDGRKLSAAISARVEGPPGLSVADAEIQEGPGAALAFAVIVPLMLELSCRDGEAPVRAILSFPRHRDDPRAERFFDNPIRSLWMGLMGDEPVYREDVRITLGGSTFPATVVRNLTSYNTETDYQALLPPAETVGEIIAATGGSLTIEVKGTRIGARASYTITAEFAERTETMGWNCGT